VLFRSKLGRCIAGSNLQVFQEPPAIEEKDSRSWQTDLKEKSEQGKFRRQKKQTCAVLRWKRLRTPRNCAL